MYEAITPRDVPRGTSTDAAAEPPHVRALRCGLPRRTFDDDYVSRLRDGDPATEEHFTAYFGELLLIKLRARMRDRQAVEDIRQETFVRVLATLKAKGALQRSESLGAFVNAVSENVLLELYRKGSRKRVVEWDEHFDPPDRRSSAESDMVTRERRQQVREILRSLPAKDRELLRMVFFEDADPDEICRCFRVSRDYLRVLVHRAKSRFRECMRKQCPEAGNAGY